MTIIEILKAAGLDDNIIQTITENMKTNKIFTASEENLDIRYGKLKDQHAGVSKQLEEANALIETMKKDTKGQEDLQKKITDHEARVAQLEKENQELRAESGMDRLLIAAGAKQSDLDYLKFQWRKKGEIAFDDQGEIKGADDIVAALKTQCPVQFEGGGGRKYEERKLPTPDEGRNAVSRETFSKMGYQDRLKLYKENPETYAELTKN
jgi:hypothetical protein